MEQQLDKYVELTFLNDIYSSKMSLKYLLWVNFRNHPILEVRWLGGPLPSHSNHLLVTALPNPQINGFGFLTGAQGVVINQPIMTEIHSHHDSDGT